MLPVAALFWRDFECSFLFVDIEQKRDRCEVEPSNFGSISSPLFSEIMLVSRGENLGLSIVDPRYIAKYSLWVFDIIEVMRVTRFKRTHQSKQSHCSVTNTNILYTKSVAYKVGNKPLPHSFRIYQAPFSSSGTQAL